MRSLLDYKGGEAIQVLEYEELIEVLDMYDLSIDDLFPGCNYEDIAGQIGWIKASPKEIILNTPDWDGLIPIQLDFGAIGLLPLVAFVDVGENVMANHFDSNDHDESAHSSEMKSSVRNEIKVVRHGPSEDYMIRLLAAETIQDAFRRYRACKSAILLKKSLANENLVLNFAAVTIQNGFKKLLTKGSRNDETKEVIKFDVKPNRESNFNIVRIKKIALQGLRNVVWNGINDPYVLLSVGDHWSYRTDTIYEAGTVAELNDIDICFPLTDKTLVSLTVMHENIARDDQLIGQSVWDVNSSVNTDSFQTVTLILQQSSSTRSANERNQNYGSIALNYKFDHGDVTHAAPPAISNLKKLPIVLSSQFLKPQSYTASPHSTATTSNQASIATSRQASAQPSRAISRELSTNTDLSDDMLRSRKFVTSPRPLSRHSSKIGLTENSYSNKAELQEPKKATPKHLSSHSSRLMIDKAHKLATQKHASSILLDYSDVDTILEALGFSLSQSNDLSGSLELPLTNPRPLAAVLSKYLKSRKRLSNTEVNLSEESAITTMQQLRGLIQGNWHKAREEILQFFYLGNSMGKPSTWPSSSIVSLMNVIEIPKPETFNNCSGEDFMSLDRRGFRHEFGIESTILQLRAIFYQEILSIIEEWWAKGVRPRDCWFAEDVRDNVLLSSESTVNKNKSSRLPSTKLNQQSDWGIVPNHGGTVEVISQSNLLDALSSFNRTYAWTIAADTLSVIANKIANKLGTLLLSRDSSVAKKEWADIYQLEEVKGCRWVRISYSPDMNQFFENLYQIAMTSPIIRKLSPQSSTEDHRLNYAILLPLLCLRESTNTSNTNNLHFTNSSVDPESLSVGMIVKVVNQPLLKRLCESFEWWDRPSDETLDKMAGLKGEIVSIAEVRSKNRIGIRIIQNDIFDALPIDAIIPYMKTGNMKKKSMKKKKVNSSRSLSYSRPSSAIKSSRQPQRPSSTKSAISALTFMSKESSLPPEREKILNNSNSNGVEDVEPGSNLNQNHKSKQLRSLGSVLNSKRNASASEAMSIVKERTSKELSSNLPENLLLTSEQTSCQIKDDESSVASKASELSQDNKSSITLNNMDYSWLSKSKPKPLIGTEPLIYNNSKTSSRPSSGAKPITIHISRSSQPIQKYIKPSPTNEARPQGEVKKTFLNTSSNQLFTIVDPILDLNNATFYNGATCDQQKRIENRVDRKVIHPKPMFVGGTRDFNMSPSRSENNLRTSYTMQDVMDYANDFEADLLPSGKIGGISIEGVSYGKPNDGTPIFLNSTRLNNANEINSSEIDDKDSKAKKGKPSLKIKKQPGKFNPIDDKINESRTIDVKDGLGIFGPRNASSLASDVHKPSSIKLSDDLLIGKTTTSNKSSPEYKQQSKTAGRPSSNERLENNNNSKMTKPSNDLSSQIVDLVFSEPVEDSKPLYSTFKPRPKSAGYNSTSMIKSNTSKTPSTEKFKTEKPKFSDQKFEDNEPSGTMYTSGQRKLYQREVLRAEKDQSNREKYLEKELRYLQRL